MSLGEPLTLILLLMLGAGLALAPRAEAVQASGSVSIVPADDTLVAAQQVNVGIRVTNTSTEPGAEFTGPSDPTTCADVAATLTGTIVVKLACTSGACTTELPGTLPSVPFGGRCCVS